MPHYPGDLLIPGQQPLWPEYCQHCGASIEADFYGVWREKDQGPLCPKRNGQQLHEPGGVLL
jgi:hypothetical protein